MTKKIFRSIITVAMTVLLASFVIACSFLYDNFNDLQVKQLKEELSLVAPYAQNAGDEYFDNLESSVFRFTIVAPDGNVLKDTQADASQMENHLDREEIKEAFENGSGSSTRYSATLTEKTFYEAVLLSDGNVLRISISRGSVGTLILGMMPAICAIVLTATVVAMVLSDRMAKSIVKPLEELDLENPTENKAYEELAPILTTINKQKKQIKQQLNQLCQKSDEFDQITASMNEGLILLDKKGIVISINAAAKKIFDTDGFAVGHDFLTVYRSTRMSRAIESALKGNNTEFREERNGREYQLVINRIESDGSTVGIVVLCFDVTEIAFAEHNRREFTANVSHELKTPLQSIIGSAELLQNGLVRPEDVSKFTNNIKNEAGRLVNLINDIIRLSQLDENREMLSETIDLSELAAEIKEALSASAQSKNVTFDVVCGSCVMQGVRRYIYEIIYNLCDNAIRYNVEGGKATLDIKNENNNTVITVSDTGIGIAPEHQPRIFERFYRVDKSHSKETGGTGLGLSIVKHAVQYHGGRLEMDSAVGKGTTIKITI